MNLSRRCLEPPVSVVKTAVEVLFCVCLTDFKAELQIRLFGLFSTCFSYEHFYYLILILVCANNT